MRRKKLIVVLILSVLLIMFLFKAFRSPKVDEQIDFSIPKDYSEIFQDNAKAGITVDICYNSSIRNSVAILSFKSRFQILMYKFRINSNLPLKQIIIPFYHRQKKFYEYYGHKMGDFDFYYALDSEVIQKNIYFSLYGDSIKQTKFNDSIFSYNVKFNGVEFMNDDQHQADFYLYRNGISPSKFCEIDFVKRGNNVFFLFTTSLRSDENVDQNIASEILN